MFRRLLVPAALLLAAGPLFAKDQPDIARTAAADGRFRTLVSLLVAADLLDALKSDGPFTVFAPTDDAFAKLPKGTVEGLLKPENRSKLAEILKYHVIPNKAAFNLSAPASDRKVPFKTLSGQSVQVVRDGHGINVNGIRVAAVNVACRNGSVQVIGSVLLPPEATAGNTVVGVAEQAGTFKTLLAALSAVELTDVLKGDGPFTVFAPTDEAFAKLPKGTVETLLKPENKSKLAELLKYHVVAGRVTARHAAAAGTAKTLQGEPVRVGFRDGRLTINEVGVRKTDLPADNGIVHVIDAVLLSGR